MVSKGKGVGPTNMLDNLVHEDIALKEELADKIQEAMNTNVETLKEHMRIKIMALSKDPGEREVNLNRIRYIAISDVAVKMFEATLRYVTQDKFTDYPSDE